MFILCNWWNDWSRFKIILNNECIVTWNARFYEYGHVPNIIVWLYLLMRMKTIWIKWRRQKEHKVFGAQMTIEKVEFNVLRWIRHIMQQLKTMRANSHMMWIKRNEKRGFNGMGHISCVLMAYLWYFWRYPCKFMTIFNDNVWNELPQLFTKIYRVHITRDRWNCD